MSHHATKIKLDSYQACKTIVCVDFQTLLDFVCVHLQFRQVIQCTNNSYSERIQAILPATWVFGVQTVKLGPPVSSLRAA